MTAKILTGKDVLQIEDIQWYRDRYKESCDLFRKIKQTIRTVLFVGSLTLLLPLASYLLGDEKFITVLLGVWTSCHLVTTVWLYRDIKKGHYRTLERNVLLYREILDSLDLPAATFRKIEQENVEKLAT